ncbi:hypothetical protein [Sandaracinus amylolyticus]|uniref:General secretion pathway protein E n=1 Tax=Sandaracinus amylolyticus TaxID=927083 RepID=A0A0F6YJA7_9BACT|nr:hypothetical protein [Sandaracinus amylolyticus]AKF07585.1 General secretion pathway protein E [Sandaracinus amylolyticus]
MSSGDGEGGHPRSRANTPAAAREAEVRDVEVHDIEVHEIQVREAEDESVIERRAIARVSLEPPRLALEVARDDELDPVLDALRPDLGPPDLGAPDLEAPAPATRSTFRAAVRPESASAPKPRRRDDPTTAIVRTARASSPPAIVPEEPPDRLAQLASEIARSGPDHLAALGPRALREGLPLLPRIAREFPGLLWLDLAHLRPRTRADQISAACAVLAAFGTASGPHLAALLAPGHAWHVRVCAARVAAQAPSAELVEPLVRALADDDATIADFAALALCAHQGQPALAAMLGRLRVALVDRSAPPFWRRTAARTFGRMREAASVPLLVEALADAEPIATAARDALRILTARDHGAYRLPWRFWWRAQRTRGRAAWLLEALDQDSPALRSRAFQELVLLTGDDLGRRHATVAREDAPALRAAYEPMLAAARAAR